jgi:hypothetical protein
MDGNLRVSAAQDKGCAIQPLLNLPDRNELHTLLGKDGLAHLLAEADEIVAGRVRLFGSEPVPLQLTMPEPLEHWTVYEIRSKSNNQPDNDIKFVWEPARFGWTYALGRAYHLSGDECYPAAFWRYSKTFLDANPPYWGSNWASAQEVALRLMAFVFAAQVFAPSAHNTPERLARLAQSVADHAARIPPTLAYARSQNNNHLLSEAAGLITAGLALPDHLQAARWLDIGRKWFIAGLQSQIAADGSYCQHSTNYHRLMLQLALWVHSVSSAKFQVPSVNSVPGTWNMALVNATRWLLSLLDPETGGVPNLGPNDGAYILPLTSCPFHDYRPVLQAASIAFLGERAFPEGPWDEMGLWLCQMSSAGRQVPGNQRSVPHDTSHVVHGTSSWAYLRVADFHSRPGHADQLHLDLWWRGLNVAQDAGTYLYNASPPWDNALAHTAVHNTLTVDGQNQMIRAGRFLWLDWAQGKLVAHEKADDGAWERLVAQHDGYRRLGIIHQRVVTAFREGRWVVEDSLLQVEGGKWQVARSKEQGARSKLQVARSKWQVTSDEPQPGACYLSPVTCTLHWLLPDFLWGIEDRDSSVEIRLQSPYGWITLRVNTPQTPNSLPLSLILARAGDLLHGSGPVSPTQGWVSPTYGTKIPALSLIVKAEGPPPLKLISEWSFPTG